MWEYSGSDDESRFDRKDFKDRPSLEMAVRGVIKGSKLKKFPTECPVNPFGGGIKLPEVSLLIIPSINFPLEYSFRL